VSELSIYIIKIGIDNLVVDWLAPTSSYFRRPLGRETVSSYTAKLLDRVILLAASHLHANQDPSYSGDTGTDCRALFLLTLCY